MRTIVALLFVCLAVAYAAELLAGESPTAIPGSYIVVLNENLAVADRDAHIATLKDSIVAAKDQSIILDRYDIGSFIAFGANLSAAMLKAELAHPDVKYIEVDQVVRSFDTDTQRGATWGLDRIDQRSLPLRTEYVYNSSAGYGAEVYVIDTGIYIDNEDFEGRAQYGANFITNEPSEDLNGHGTHCAGTIGGALYGVAKQVALFGVKVLDESGSGTNTGVISGVNWVTKQKGNLPVIASMSLGGGISTALDNAVANSIAAGIIYVVAAGNDNQNACNYSPARVASAITVGATDSNDRRASYSNYGSCVDIFAPGTNIDSDWIGAPDAHLIISGTSMATPHVSGALALHLADYPKDATPTAAAKWLTSVATSGAITSPGTGSPNLLLYTPY